MDTESKRTCIPKGPKLLLCLISSLDFHCRCVCLFCIPTCLALPLSVYSCLAVWILNWEYFITLLQFLVKKRKKKRSFKFLTVFNHV